MLTQTIALPEFFIVVTEFETEGFASAGDATTSRDTAYDQFAEAREEGQPARAFLLQFDVSNSTFETASEVTEEFEAEYGGILIAAE